MLETILHKQREEHEFERRAARRNRRAQWQPINLYRSQRAKADRRNHIDPAQAIVDRKVSIANSIAAQQVVKKTGRMAKLTAGVRNLFGRFTRH
jgi:hypothetical protein